VYSLEGYQGGYSPVYLPPSLLRVVKQAKTPPPSLLRVVKQAKKTLFLASLGWVKQTKPSS